MCPGAHVDPVDVVLPVVGAGDIEVARDSGLHLCRRRHARCVVSLETTDGGKTHAGYRVSSSWTDR